jgi:class I fructose-bisphosphate aldolase
MMYGRGPKIANEFDPDVVAHCARVGMELGADVVKVPYTGDPDSFSRVVDACCIPVVIAGGPKVDQPRAFFQMVHDSIQAGGAGLSIGRNIFQSDDPSQMVRALTRIVHEDGSIEEALEIAGVRE